MEKTQKSNFRKAVLFPFKVLLRVGEIALLFLFAMLISLVFYCLFRADQPMTLVSANGMTYSAFLENRIQTLDPSGTPATHIQTIGIPVARAWLISLPATLSPFFPNQNIGRYLDYPLFDLIANKNTEVYDLLDNYWTTFENASWLELVIEQPDYPEPGK